MQTQFNLQANHAQLFLILTQTIFNKSLPSTLFSKGGIAEGE